MTAEKGRLRLLMVVGTHTQPKDTAKKEEDMKPLSRWVARLRWAVGRGWQLGRGCHKKGTVEEAGASCRMVLVVEGGEGGKM